MQELETVKKEFLKAVEANSARFTALSDEMFRNPEVGLQERRTSSSMQALLREFGFTVEADTADMPTAFTARFGTGKPVVTLLAEMDALPDIGHGCGHNIGGVASVGAGACLATALEGVLDPGRGTICVFGTPAEELGHGKTEMIKAGVFEGVDAAMMVHASSKRTVVKHFLGLIELKFTFTGRPSHASAYPEEGINALDGVIQTFNSINALRQQTRDDVRIHGIITDGGRVPNVIPETASAHFFVRANDIVELTSVKDKVIRCAEGAALATGAELVVEQVGDMTAPMKLNNTFANIYRKALAMLDLDEDMRPPDKNVGSSDIGDVSQVVPAIHPHVPIGENLKIHTREFAQATASEGGHRALIEGITCLGLTALELLLDPLALSAVTEEFKK